MKTLSCDLTTPKMNCSSTINTIFMMIGLPTTISLPVKKKNSVDRLTLKISYEIQFDQIDSLNVGSLVI